MNESRDFRGPTQPSGKNSREFFSPPARLLAFLLCQGMLIASLETVETDTEKLQTTKNDFVGKGWKRACATKKNTEKNESQKSFFEKMIQFFPCRLLFLCVFTRPRFFQVCSIVFHPLLSSFSNLSLLGGWANHQENMDQIGSFPQVKAKMQNLGTYNLHCHSSKLGLFRSLGHFLRIGAAFPSYFTPYPASKNFCKPPAPHLKKYIRKSNFGIIPPPMFSKY